MRKRSAALFVGVWTVAVLCVPPGIVVVAVEGCGSKPAAGTGSGGGGSGTTSGSGGDAGGPKTVVRFPDATPLPGESECKVVETTEIPIKVAVHIPTCTPIAYATNPPSGGDHWGVWATYAKHAVAVPREMYLHNMEHGGVVLAYHCKDGCPDVVAALGKVFDQVADPACTGQPIPARVVLTPDPDLDAPIAVTAWGATYVATCLDEASILDFVGRVIDQGTEKVCANGMEPEPIAAGCADAGVDAADGGEQDGG